MKISIIMRSHNDMPLISETLGMLERQTHPFELVALDNASADGTLDALRQHTEHIVNIPKGQYVPGRVLNTGMAESTGDIVAFLNSDCTPENEQWLENLVRGFDGEKVAAVFGRQLPRPDCHPLHAKDTDATYGDGRLQERWKHCFSMASSAIRRSVWESMPFNEELQYSEDIEWTWKARQKGYEIRYVCDSVVFHSHNYSVAQFYKRHYGEGKAEAVFFDWSGWERTWFRYSLLPLGRQIASDWKYALGNRNVRLLLQAPVYRVSQMLGRRAGFLDGWAGKTGASR